jgi:hypothetical protein
LNSGAFRAPELGQASRTPMRSARRLAQKMFFNFDLELFMKCHNFLSDFDILEANVSYPVFSYRVFWLH